MRVLKSGFDVVDGYDISDDKEFPTGEPYGVMHVCIPWGEQFLYAVEVCRGNWLAEGGLIVVHSSVPIGTTEKIGPDAVHSPIRGVHPHLEEGIRTFAKYVGGPRAGEAADIFVACGIETRAVPLAKTTEAAKLWCTTVYGMQILIEKTLHAFCEKHGLDFDVVYTTWTESYNEGYAKLGMAHVARPVLKHVPGAIGGHCVVPNAKLLDDQMAEAVVRGSAEFAAIDDQTSPGVHSE